MFHEPIAPGSPKPGTKPDSTASARSTIRRERTVGSSRGANEVAYPTADRVARLFGETDHGVETSRRETVDSRRNDHGRALLRDALSYERPGRRMRHLWTQQGLPPLPPPLPAPPTLTGFDPHWARPSMRPTEPHNHEADGAEENASAFDRIARRNRHLLMTMPRMPDSPEDSDSEVPLQADSTQAGTRSLSFTPGFAPANTSHRPPSRRGLPSPVSLERPSAARSFSPDTFPPLRRIRRASVGSRRRSRSPRSQNVPVAIDGLGDRERSFSPDNYGDTHDHWETVLSTITPDTQLPSTDSSFTSAAVTASLSRGDGLSPASESTRLTPPNDREGVRDREDLSDDSMLTDNSENERRREALHLRLQPPNVSSSIRRLHRLESAGWSPRYGFAPEPYPGARSPERQPDLRENRRHSPRSRHLDRYTGRSATTSANISGRPGTQRRRNVIVEDRTSLAENNTHTRASDQQTDGGELHGMQHVLERLAARADIPDSWWAEAGLQRIIRRSSGPQGRD